MPAKKQVAALLAKGAVIIDVRSSAEFAEGAREGSLNIPLQELEKQLGKLDPQKPIILCCASGGRAGMAEALLRSKGFKEVLNVGPWRNTIV